MLIQATTQTTFGNVYILSNDDDLNVAAGVTLTSTYTDPATHTGADAVISWIGAHRITVSGTIIGADEAINLAGCTPAQTVIIHASGQLFGGGDGVVEDADGVILDGAGSTLRNLGMIHAYGSAVSAMVLDNTTLTITNAGSMYGRIAGIWHKFGNGVMNFTNSGTIESPGHAFLGGGSTDNVTNTGVMIGIVDLGGGDDSYIGRTGQVIGDILGGSGDDRFQIGNFAESIDGGDGQDTLDLSHATAGVTVNLTLPAQNSGAAVAGDTYTSIENLTGSAFGDRLVGNAENNILIGGGKDDTLAGADGDDIIIGGAAKDRTYGGAGADSFQFNRWQEGGDFIYDFVSGTDRITVVGAAFGFGTTVGTLAETAYCTGTTNHAQDADDRFIFRIQDQTLWFDADGTGSGAGKLIADLQTGATFTFADITII